MHKACFCYTRIDVVAPREGQVHTSPCDKSYLLRQPS